MNPRILSTRTNLDQPPWPALQQNNAGLETDESQFRQLDADNCAPALDGCKPRCLEAGRGGPSSAVHSATLLKAAASLEVHLLQQARCVLAASEEDRKRMSLQLSDEAAQSLFGIQFRLSALRKKIAAGDADVSPEIASTRHLVEQSVKIILRIASEFEPPHETRTN